MDGDRHGGGWDDRQDRAWDRHVQVVVHLFLPSPGRQQLVAWVVAADMGQTPPVTVVGSSRPDSTRSCIP